MRLLYSDQRTPAPRLFKYEDFDKATIRTAVGDLVCGIRGFDLFEVELQIRELEIQFSTVDTQWRALLNSFPDQIAVTVAAVTSEIAMLQLEIEHVQLEIEKVDQQICDDQNSRFHKERKQAVKSLKKLRMNLKDSSRLLEISELEQHEIKRFIEHLSSSHGFVLKC